jgi:hypothetical protein
MIKPTNLNSDVQKLIRLLRHMFADSRPISGMELGGFGGSPPACEEMVTSAFQASAETEPASVYIRTQYSGRITFEGKSSNLI